MVYDVDARTGQFTKKLPHLMLRFWKEQTALFSQPPEAFILPEVWENWFPNSFAFDGDKASIFNYNAYIHKELNIDGELYKEFTKLGAVLPITDMYLVLLINEWNEVLLGSF